MGLATGSCWLSGRSRRRSQACRVSERSTLDGKRWRAACFSRRTACTSSSALAALAMAGEVDDAQAGLERVIAAAERSGDRLTAAGHRLWRGLVRYEAGELLLAEQDLILEPIPFWQASTPLAYRAGFLTQVLARARRDRRGRAVDRRHLARRCRGRSPHSLRLRAGVDSDSNRAPRNGRSPTSPRSGLLAESVRVPQPRLRPVALAGGDCAAAARA